MKQTQNTEKNWLEYLKGLKAKVKNLDDAIVNAKKELNAKRDELNAVEDSAMDYGTFKKAQKLKEEKQFISNILADLNSKRDAVILEALPEFNKLAVGHLNDEVKAIEEDSERKAKQYYDEYFNKLSQLFDDENEKVKQLQQANSGTKELLHDLFHSHLLQANHFDYLHLEILQYGVTSAKHERMKNELLFDRIF